MIDFSHGRKYIIGLIHLPALPGTPFYSGDGMAPILQKAVEVQPEDTAKELQLRVMQEAEWKILPQAIDLIANGRIAVEDGRVVQKH